MELAIPSVQLLNITDWTGYTINDLIVLISVFFKLIDREKDYRKQMSDNSWKAQPPTYNHSCMGQAWDWTLSNVKDI